MDELRQLVRALEEAGDAIREREHKQQTAEQALRAADRAKDEFLAMLGHELRNPLASVSNASHLLKAAPGRPDVIETVGAILARQVEQMTRLVDDLLEVGRVTGGKIRLETRAARPGHGGDGGDRDLAQRRSLPAPRGPSDLREVWVHADRTRIEQVVANLLDNALKYTPARGRIDISVRPEGDAAIVEVRDTGEGMPPELIERVFDLFVQGERSLARERGGSGIGLTLARRLVEMNDGTIRATSEGRGRGATFRVSLPAIERRVAPSGISRAVAEATPSAARLDRRGS